MDLCNPTMGFYRVFTFLLLYSLLFWRINGQSETCSDPGTPENTVRSGDSWTKGSTVSYNCVAGTKYSTGDWSRTCLGNPGWSGQPLVCTPPSNCREAYSLQSIDSGEKILLTASGKEFKFFCHFAQDKIYGLLHKDIFFDNSAIDLDVTRLYDHMDEAVIGFFDNNNNLYVVRAGRLDHTSSEKRPVIMWNENNGFVAPDTTNEKYLFLGFYEEHEAGQPGAARGIYIVDEGKDCSFTVGGQRGKRYIAFYGETVSDEFPHEGIYPCVIDGKQLSEIHAPADDYSLFASIQFSGGGAHLTTDQLTDYDGMNFIFTYDYDNCGDPGQHDLTERSGDSFTKGSTVTYNCVSGNKYSTGDWSRTCMGKAGWSAKPLVCMPPSSCREAYYLGSTASGEKVLATASGKHFKMFCHFGGRIYALLHKDIFFDNSGIDLDLTQLYDHMDSAMIGLFDISYYNLYRVIAHRMDYSSTNKIPVIMWNNHHGFTAPAKTDANYLFLGFYDEQEAAQVEQGIQTFQIDDTCASTQCTGSTESYIAFYGGNDGSNSFEEHSLLSCLAGSAQRVAINGIPNDGYRLYGEMGWCGHHQTSDTITYYDGMNYIFTYHYATCEDPGTPINTERSGDSFTPGSTVIYTCLAGTEYISGDESTTCIQDGLGNTEWSGSALVCMPSKYL